MNKVPSSELMHYSQGNMQPSRFFILWCSYELCVFAVASILETKGVIT
jgi:hypothetical protein